MQFNAVSRTLHRLLVSIKLLYKVLLSSLFLSQHNPVDRLGEGTTGLKAILRSLICKIKDQNPRSASGKVLSERCFQKGAFGV
jgi:hypothetical protein